MAQRIISRIPNKTEELFKFVVDWTQLTESLLKGRLKQWIQKKIIEFLGEEENELTQLLLDKIEHHIEPKTMVTEFEEILDSETQGFVVKLWRLIIYETEARRLGLIQKK